MGKRYEVLQNVTITYVKIVDADSRDEAFELAGEIDLDDWTEVDVDSDGSMYIRELDEEA